VSGLELSGMTEVLDRFEAFLAKYEPNYGLVFRLEGHPLYWTAEITPTRNHPRARECRTFTWRAGGVGPLEAMTAVLTAAETELDSLEESYEPLRDRTGHADHHKGTAPS